MKDDFAEELKIKTALPDEAAGDRAVKHWNSIAKPIGGLGLLEENVVRIARITGNEKVKLSKRGVIVMCADNGVVAEGVSQTGQEVTALVAGNMTRGDSSVCRMAKIAGADVFPVDIGMIAPVPGVTDRAVMRGTNNMTQGPAMTREQALKAIRTGMELVAEKKAEGYKILATGEMGIGNTTTSSAVAAVLLQRPVAELTGRGAGLSDEGLQRKIRAIEKALEVNRPDGDDALDVLAKVGGLDIAGMTGVFLGGAVYRVPILLDGFISAVSALIAARLCPDAKIAMLASHVSSEPAAKWILNDLGLKPMITAGLHLGEGTGAVCALPLLDMALAVYNGMSSFDDIGLKAYEVHP